MNKEFKEFPEGTLEGISSRFPGEVYPPRSQKVWPSSEVLQKMVDELPWGLKLLELGCGIAKLEYKGQLLRIDKGLDTAADMVLDWHHDMEMLHHRFDGIVMSDCFYEYNHPVIEHIFEWVKPDGFLLIVDPCRREALEYIRQVVCSDKYNVHTKYMTYKDAEYIVWRIERK